MIHGNSKISCYTWLICKRLLSLDFRIHLGQIVSRCFLSPDLRNNSREAVFGSAKKHHLARFGFPINNYTVNIQARRHIGDIHFNFIAA